VTVKTREGTPSGTVMASQQVQVPGSLLYPGALFHVTFALPVQVTPGNTYLIEVYWGSTNSTGVSWMSPDADTYPRGNGGMGSSPAGWDLNFQTWGLQTVGGEVMPTPLTSIMPVAVLLGVASLVLAAPKLSKRPR